MPTHSLVFPPPCSALIFGAIFNRMGRSQSSIQDRLGLLQVCAFGVRLTISRYTMNQSNPPTLHVEHTHTHCHTHTLPHCHTATLPHKVAAINTAMSSLVKTLNVFPRERLIVNRERAKYSYRTAPYLAAKVLAELPLGGQLPWVLLVVVLECGAAWAELHVAALV